MLKSPILGLNHGADFILTPNERFTLHRSPSIFEMKNLSIKITSTSLGKFRKVAGEGNQSWVRTVTIFLIAAAAAFNFQFNSQFFVATGAD